jgi:hypothetical protein
MRGYVIATGIVFSLIFVLHVARIVVEGPWMIGQPIFIATTLLSLVVATWAAWLIFRGPR